MAVAYNASLEKYKELISDIIATDNLPSLATRLVAQEAVVAGHAEAYRKERACAAQLNLVNAEIRSADSCLYTTMSALADCETRLSELLNKARLIRGKPGSAQVDARQIVSYGQRIARKYLCDMSYRRARLYRSTREIQARCRFAGNPRLSTDTPRQYMNASLTLSLSLSHSIIMQK